MTEEEAALHAAQQVSHLYAFFTAVGIAGAALITMAFFGSLTSRQALKRGHLPRKWFWIGFGLPLIGLVVLFLIEPGPAAQTRREHWFTALFRSERVWDAASAETQATTRRTRLSKAGVVLATAAAGFVIGSLLADTQWGIVWAVIGGLLGMVGLMAWSIATDRAPEPAPGYTPDADRPPEPRRVVTLLWPLLIAFVAFWLGGVFGDLLWGAVWGVIASAGVIGALHFAKERPTLSDMAVVALGVTASTVLTSAVVLSELPEALTANLSLQMAGAWLPAGIASAVLSWRRKVSPAKALTMVLGWAGAGLMALPASVSFDLLKPLSSWVGEPDPFNTVTYAFIGITVALIGGAFLLSGLTSLNSLATATTVAYVTAYAGAQVGFTIPGLIENFTNLSTIAKKMWPPDFEWAIGTGTWWNLTSWDFGSELRANPLIETFRIAVIACTIGVTLAVPLALRASRITAIRGSDYWLNKGIMNVIRTIPDLFWAMIFATSVGIGPFAGTLALIFFSMAIMAKLLSETVDAVDPRPIEAARATGSHHWPAMRTSVWPQVLPNYVAYALYIFEINIRASVVLGIVGAGGIGRVLEAQRSFFRFDRVLAIVIVIFVIVFLIEQVSVALRRRLV